MKQDLPNWKRALAKYADSLPSGTYWRYLNGLLPAPLGPLLLSDPELAAALAADAAALQAQQADGKAAHSTAAAGGD